MGHLRGCLNLLEDIGNLSRHKRLPLWGILMVRHQSLLYEEDDALEFEIKTYGKVGESFPGVQVTMVWIIIMCMNILCELVDI